MWKLDSVATFASQLAGVTTGAKWGRRTWLVGDRGFAWERPLSKADVARYGNETPPLGDIIGVLVENLDAKDALLAMGLPGFFTIQHFNGYPAILVALRTARAVDVRRVIKDAWRIATATPPSRKVSPKTPAKPRSKSRRVARRST